jgi:hypothetical protein
MDCYLALRRSSSSTGHADVTAPWCHAATSDAVVGDTGLSSVRDASLDGTTHGCQGGGTHEARSTSPVGSSPRRLGRADAIHSADAVFRDCATWATSSASHSLRRPSNSTRRRPEPICAASPVAALVRPEGVAERRIITNKPKRPRDSEADRSATQRRLASRTTVTSSY